MARDWAGAIIDSVASPTDQTSAHRYPMIVHPVHKLSAKIPRWCFARNTNPMTLGKM